jgi:hypothetical protein
MEKASEFCLSLNRHVSMLSGGGPTILSGSVPLGDFQKFKAAHNDSLATIWQKLKGGAIKVGGFNFNGEDQCLAFAQKHLTRELTYHCIPSFMFVMAGGQHAISLQLSSPPRSHFTTRRSSRRQEPPLYSAEVNAMC